MKKIYIMIVVVFTVKASFAQNFKEFYTGFVSIFKNTAEFNSYYFGGNPALLDFLKEDELLSLSSNIEVDDGKFKRFIQPASGLLYQLFVSGKKGIDENQKFKGSFGFQREERNKWDWFFTRDYQTGNPFLIGDSTSGDSRINGIVMNAGYVIKLTDILSAGITLDYSVDEMLKKVSPKPTSVHRDIHSRVGFNCKLNNSFNFGVMADAYDRNERIAYREDEGSITQETIILKFKGYDYPNVFRKKAETRYSYLNGYGAGLTSSYDIQKEIILTGFILAGFNKTNIKDDATNPMAEGFWKNDYKHAGLQFSYHFPDDLNASLTYNFRKENGWGKYSPYNVLYFERDLNSHSLILGFDYPLNKYLVGGIEGGLNLTSLEEKDHYSAVFVDSKSRSIFGKLGLFIIWNSDFSTMLSYGYLNNSIPNYTYSVSTNSNYYSSFRQFDLLYYLTGSYKQEFSITSSVNPGIGGIFLIYFNYSLLKPFMDSVFGNENKVRFNSVIEYRIKVF